MKKKKILFLTNHLAFFVSHRLNIFQESKKRSYDFLLLSGKKSSIKMEKIAQKKIKLHKVPYKIIDFNSYDFKILKEIKSLINLYKIIKKYQPDIFHTVAPKTNLYGGFLSLFLNINLTVLSFSGMGFLFTGKLSFKDFLKKKIYKIFLKIIFINKNLVVIVQNKTDYMFFKKEFNLKKNVKLIKGGSGINFKKLNKIKKNKAKNIVFSGRLVFNKGIKEYIEAAKELKNDFPDWNFLIYGTRDYLSQDKFNLDDYKKEIKEKVIIYKGYEKDVGNIIKNTTIFCLPSYREGMPKSVLEASAAGIPCVVSDAPGCKESVINRSTGLIVKTKNSKDLIKKIRELINKPKLRNIMSQNAKKFAKEEASIEKITKTIFKIYEKK